MGKMYRGCAHTGTITPFEVQNSTPKTVVFKNSVGVIERELKTTENHCWMETNEECREWLLTIYKNKVNAAQWAIEYNQSLIKKVNEQ